jgi:nucleoside-diphosphate-sugar epimerase
VLVLGGTGFIGARVVAALVRAGAAVTTLQRGTDTVSLPDGVGCLVGDRRRLSDHRPEIARLDPDVVVDMIAYSEEDARQLLEALGGLSCRVVCVSSADVYRAYARLHRSEPGPPDPVPLTEQSPLRERLYPYRRDPPRALDDPQRWLDHYDKLPIERAVLASRESVGTVLRLPMVYGPGDPQHRLGEVARRVHDDRDVIPLEQRHARWRSCWGYVENMGHAVALCATDERAAGGIYNVSDATSLPIAPWHLAAARSIGWTGRVVTLPAQTAPAHLRLLHDSLDLSQDLVLDSTHIREQLGYREPIPLEQALRRTLEWELEACAGTAGQLDYAAEDAALDRAAK